jgi:catechol 2,3-dioxygenase-like lactoylglutathione lyase family enzyme
MSGIFFQATENLERVRRFYVERLGFDIWLEQTDCVILRSGNLLVGFCKRERVDSSGMLCIVKPDRASVDFAYQQLNDIAEVSPVANPRYDIYHFFCSDPDGRTVEVQSFDHPVDLPA